jgi:CheY-like chemotaxis protein
MGRRILTDAGYDVITVNNGSAALKKINENKPDLIVLDVYMPGYGGLEVCQRVKENPETTRIPVLLTVGKLEPFKPDEARRVGADAFIIKPFEATELLTALTKLEDKIVAGPQPQKSGRFAKALAAVEQSEKGERFGDKETGWKNRLTIPAPNFKPAPGEAEPNEVPTARSSDLERGEGFKPVESRQEFERPIPAGLPADITPEEIAAIAAAAASIGSRSQETVAVPEAAPANVVASQEVASTEVAAVEIAAVAPSPPEAAAVSASSAPDAEKETRAEAPADALPVAAEVVAEAVASEPARPDDLPAASELPAVAAQTDSETRIVAETQASAAEKPTGDSEVMAAIASLAPANGHAVENIQPAAQVSASGQNFSVSAYHSGISAALQATGSRWIAETVAVASDEAVLVLEREMEQAHATSVATDAAPSNLPAATATVSEIPSQPSVVESTENVEPAIAAVASVEASVEATAAAEPAPAAIAAESVGAEPPVVEVAEAAVVTGESAYAAAASASSAAEHAQPVSPGVIAPGFSPDNSPAYPESTPQREAELAAAWQNWKQIRESFVSSSSGHSPEPSSESGSEPSREPVSEHATEPVSELSAASPVEESSVAGASSQPVSSQPVSSQTETEEAKPEVVEVAGEAAFDSEDGDEDESDTPGESTAIASIVDSMLAELRPKLVEEIAKKMNSENEKKDKDKKKKKK